MEGRDRNNVTKSYSVGCCIHSLAITEITEGQERKVNKVYRQYDAVYYLEYIVPILYIISHKGISW